MAKRSTGILMYRGQEAALEVLPVHPGGPFWVPVDTTEEELEISRSSASAQFGA